MIKSGLFYGQDVKIKNTGKDTKIVCQETGDILWTGKSYCDALEVVRDKELNLIEW